MQRKPAKFMLSGVNSIDVYKCGHVPQQLLSNICSFSRCLAAEWTKCYGNLSVSGGMEGSFTSLDDGRSWPGLPACHVHLEHN